MAENRQKNTGPTRKQAILISSGILFVAVAVAGFIIWQAMQGEHENNSESVVYEQPEDVLNFPGRDAPGEQILRHRDFIVDSAIRTSTIELNNCVPNPLIVQTAIGAKLLIKNNDNVLRTLFWADEVEAREATLEVPANGEAVLSVDFISREDAGDLMIIGYRCGPSLKPAGILLMFNTPEEELLP